MAAIITSGPAQRIAVAMSHELVFHWHAGTDLDNKQPMTPTARRVSDSKITWGMSGKRTSAYHSGGNAAIDDPEAKLHERAAKRKGSKVPLTRTILKAKRKILPPTRCGLRVPHPLHPAPDACTGVACALKVIALKPWGAQMSRQHLHCSMC